LVKHFRDRRDGYGTVGWSKRLSRHRASIAPSLWNVGWIGVRVHETTEQVIAVAAEAVQHFDELAANEPGRPAAAVKIRVHGSAAMTIVGRLVTGRRRLSVSNVRSRLTGMG